MNVGPFFRVIRDAAYFLTRVKSQVGDAQRQPIVDWGYKIHVVKLNTRARHFIKQYNLTATASVIHTPNSTVWFDPSIINTDPNNKIESPCRL